MIKNNYLIKKLIFYIFILFHPALYSQEIQLYHSSGKKPSEILNSNFGEGASSGFIGFVHTVKYLVERNEVQAISGLIEYPFVYQSPKGNTFRIKSRQDFEKKYNQIFNEKIITLLSSINENEWKVDGVGVAVGVDKVYFQCRSNKRGLYWRLVTINQW